MGFAPRQLEDPFEPWSVAALTAHIRELFEVDYRLRDVAVIGEISNFRRAASGHLYFTLKDEEAQLRCVMWRSEAPALPQLPGDGDEVLIRGYVSVYDAMGVYQLYARSIQPRGRGGLAERFEQLKESLAAEGLFAAEHKQAIPDFPRKIGIVTSRDAAALRDILNVLRRRFPGVAVLIAPALVQGHEAPAQLIRALQWLDGRVDVDTIIVARGGGSLEDLWAFNDEELARAIFAARHPVICGVGHETDFTIADFVADLRAPTPSVAAELAVPDRAELMAQAGSLQERLRLEIADYLRQAQRDLRAWRQTLRLLSPRASLDRGRQEVDVLAGALSRAMGRRLEIAESRLAVASSSLSAVSPLATLGRGYAIVRGREGAVVRSVQDVSPGDSVEVQVSDGSFGARVDA